MRPFVVLGCIAALAVGCGGKSQDSSAAAATGGEGAAGGGGSGAGGSGGGSGAGGAGGGDATDAGAGPSYKLRIGPIHVDAGTEKTQCVVVRLSNTEKIHVGSIHDEISGSSHHMIVYRTNETEERTTPFDCKPFVMTLDPSQGAPLAITQKKDDLIQLPPGVGYTFDAGQMFRLELHYINATGAPADVQGDVTLGTIPDADFHDEAELLFVGSPDIRLKPHASATLGPVFLPLPQDLAASKFFAITGHEHHLGTNVTVSTVDASQSSETMVYDVPNWSWSEPKSEQFDPPFQVPAGGGFRFTCEWNNTTSQTVTFGESVNDEMCFFWAYYYPSKGARVCVASEKYHVTACCPGDSLCGLVSQYLGN